MDHLRGYAGSAAQDGGWVEYSRQFLAGSEQDYIATVGGAERLAQLPPPVF
jgi:hypothetical protein